MYMYNVEELIAMAAEKRASDVHLIAGLPPKCRIDGEIVNLADVPLSKEDCDTYGLELAGEHIKKIDSIGQLDFAPLLQDDGSELIFSASREPFPQPCDF